MTYKKLKVDGKTMRVFRKITMFISRILCAIRFFFWIIFHNELVGENMFRVLNDILALLLRVATEDRHYMTKMMITIDRDVAQPIVYIWAGAGASADPYKRIQELVEENDALKQQIKSPV